MRNLPSEMQSRPKIPRTPLDGEKPEPVYNPNNPMQQDIPQSGEDVVPKIKGEVVKDDKQIEEFKSAFVTKDMKIPRTPPEEDRNRYMEKRAVEYQNYNQNGVSSSLPMLPNTMGVQSIQPPFDGAYPPANYGNRQQANNYYQQPIAPS